MKILIKPIQFVNLKEEISINIESHDLIANLILKVVDMTSDTGNNLDFMFRGKKLVSDKTLGEQGVKENTKLMMYQSETKSFSPTKEQVSIKNKDEAKSVLINKGFKIDIIDSVIKTIPNVDNLTSESIIEKSLIFLKSLTKESISEYSIEVNESNSSFDIDEDKITTVFTIGDGIQGQLGIGKYIKTDFPLRVSKLRNVKIKTISCGVYHTAALTLNGHGKRYKY